MLSPEEHAGVDWLIDLINAPAAIVACDGRILATNRTLRDRLPGATDDCGHRRRLSGVSSRRPCERQCTDWLSRLVGNDTNVTCRGVTLGEANACLCLPGGSIERPRVSQPAEFVGCSASYHRTMEAIDRAGACSAPALLMGETGTGKELVAREIHRRSDRSAHPLVCVDCPALSADLFASELFGHEKGAFTGATATKPGLVETCHGGTLFLDEIGELPLSQQSKLLRLLEDGRFRRVGGTVERYADFRLICATNRDLEVMTGNGQFRPDLYHRVNVLAIELPPLRERPEDIPLLVAAAKSRLGLDPDWFVTPEAMEMLWRHDYPGNVRELFNIIERGSVLGDGLTLSTSHLPEVLRLGGDANPPEAGRVLTLAEFENQYLRRMAAMHQGSRRSLARRLGVSERTLYRRLKAVGRDLGTSSIVAP